MIQNALLLGVLQGILEWLPVSSQGNLSLVMVGLLGFAPGEAVKMAVLLHAGTLLSVLVYFRRDFLDILKRLRRWRPDFSGENALVSFLVVATALTGAVGFALFSYAPARNLPGEAFLGIIGISLIASGILQRAAKAAATPKALNFKDSVLTGALQGLSAIPGISRSGITVSSLLLRGYPSKDALRLSFLMSVPAVLGAEIGLSLMNALPDVSMADAAAGVVSSFIVGLAGIHILLKAATKIRFWLFCMAIGTVAIAAVAFSFFV